MTNDSTHLQAHREHLSYLRVSLSNERNRLNLANTVQERDLRRVWIKQLEKEIESCEQLINRMEPSTFSDDLDFDMTDEELLAELRK